MGRDPTFCVWSLSVDSFVCLCEVRLVLLCLGCRGSFLECEGSSFGVIEFLGHNLAGGFGVSLHFSGTVSATQGRETESFEVG